MRARNAVATLLIILAIAIPAIAYFGLELPVDTQYNRMFASHIVMAEDQATFDGVRNQVITIWTTMNTSFAGKDPTQIYNTPWYWGQTYDNSLAAQNDYFRQLVDRIDLYQNTYVQSQKNNTSPTLLTDWYDKSIQNLRVEMNRSGGLDWALHDAWYINFQPIIYWMWWFIIPLEIIFCIAIAAILLSQSDSSF